MKSEKHRSIAQMVETFDEDRLVALTDAQVGDFLLGVIEAYDDEYESADFDRLVSMGVVFAKTGHENADQPVLRWLVENPSARRLDIVSTLLLGLWNRSLRQGPVAAPKLDLLRQARQDLVLDEYVEYNYLLALSRAADSDAPQHVKDLVAQVLVRALKRKFQNPHVQSVLQSTLQHILKR